MYLIPFFVDTRSKSIEIITEAADLDNQTVFENQSAVLRCRVRSLAYPFIAWVRYNHEIRLNDSERNFNAIPHQVIIQKDLDHVISIFFKF